MEALQAFPVIFSSSSFLRGRGEKPLAVRGRLTKAFHDDLCCQPYDSQVRGIGIRWATNPILILNSWGGSSKLESITNMHCVQTNYWVLSVALAKVGCLVTGIPSTRQRPRPAHGPT